MYLKHVRILRLGNGSLTTQSPKRQVLRKYLLSIKLFQTPRGVGWVDSYLRVGLSNVEKKSRFGTFDLMAGAKKTPKHKRETISQHTLSVLIFGS